VLLAWLSPTLQYILYGTVLTLGASEEGRQSRLAEPVVPHRIDAMLAILPLCPRRSLSLLPLLSLSSLSSLSLSPCLTFALLVSNRFCFFYNFGSRHGIGYLSRACWGDKWADDEAPELYLVGGGDDRIILREGCHFWGLVGRRQQHSVMEGFRSCALQTEVSSSWGRVAPLHGWRVWLGMEGGIRRYMTGNLCSGNLDFGTVPNWGCGQGWGGDRLAEQGVGKNIEHSSWRKAHQAVLPSNFSEFGGVVVQDGNGKLGG
jgi:hypothetical protein